MKHKAGDGFCAAAASLFRGVPKVLSEFKKLNTREARAAFADHWIGVWARDFDVAWPVIYELLKQIEEEELYKDPERVGPGAPGYPKETHGEQSSYPDFATYFTDRVKQRFDTWAELERTYQYAQRYAPAVFELPYQEAREELKKEGGQQGNQNARKAKNESRNTRVVSIAQSQTTAYILAKLKRDGHMEILERIDRGQISAHRAAVELGWRSRMVQVPATVDGFVRAINRHLSKEQRTELKERL